MSESADIVRRKRFQTNKVDEAKGAHLYSAEYVPGQGAARVKARGNVRSSDLEKRRRMANAAVRGLGEGLLPGEGAARAPERRVPMPLQHAEVTRDPKKHACHKQEAWALEFVVRGLAVDFQGGQHRGRPLGTGVEGELAPVPRHGRAGHVRLHEDAQTPQPPSSNFFNLNVANVLKSNGEICEKNRWLFIISNCAQPAAALHEKLRTLLRSARSHLRAQVPRARMPRSSSP